MSAFSWEGLDLKVDAGDFCATCIRLETGALAELCEAQVAITAEIKAHADEDAINLNTRITFKLEQQIH